MTYQRPTVGIVGAGQLARMMAQAAIPLDIRIVLLAASSADGAAQVVPDVVLGAPDDAQALRALAEQCEVVTFDHELVDPALLADLEAAGHRIYPTSQCMALAQDKRRQRQDLGAAGFPMPAHANVDDVGDVAEFGAAHGFPIVLKASRGGYDGRGVWIVHTIEAAERVVAGAQSAGTVLLAEAFLPLDLELAVLVARRPSGQVVAYPPIETVQQDGICRELHVPAPISEALGAYATRIATDIAEQIGMVGIMAVEFFVSRGELSVNELAPRPHNSGHWTIEGAETSQFEQHLRAVLDLPLGSTQPTGDGVATINLLGEGGDSDPRLHLGDALAAGGGHVHFYGKEPRAGRKVGHVTAVADSLETAITQARATSDALLRSVPAGGGLQRDR